MREARLSGAILFVVLAGSAEAETLKVHVESAQAGKDELTEMPTVTIALKPESKIAFGDFTRARVGEQVTMRLGETALSAPIIREPITGGVLVISGQLTEASARDLAIAIMKGDAALEIDGSDK